MSQQQFTPVVYLLEPCPFCLKFMIFLEEAGLLDRFEIKSFTPGTPEQQSIRAELEPNVDRVTFPTVQVAPGEYIRDSDKLMAHYSSQASKPVADMPLLNYYLRGIFPAYGQLFQENKMLKAAANPA